MPEIVRDKLQRLRGLLRSRVWIGGLCAVAAVVCGAFLIGAVLDRLVMGDSVSGRWVLSILVYGAIGWTVYRELLRPLAVPLTDLWLATRIEARYPQLRGALASTVEFLNAGYSPQFGSPELQRQGVDRALRELLTVDPERVVEDRPVKRRIGSAALLAAIAAACIVAAPTEAWTAVRRICLPFSSAAWPRDVELQFQDRAGNPLTEAELSGRTFPRGSVWELQVVNARGDVPDDLTLERRTAEQRIERTSIPRTLTADGELLVGTLRLEMRESFAFRVTGGDDETCPWYDVEVVPPPMLQELKLIVHPPPYTEQPSREVPPGTSFVQLVVGSGLEIRGTANVPLSAARLANAEETLAAFRAEESRLEFQGVIPMSTLGPQFLRLELTDLDGITNETAARLEIVTVADKSPTVRFQTPASDLFLTPDAQLDVAVEAGDDFGLTTLDLQFLKRTPDAPGEAELIESRALLQDSEVRPTTATAEAEFRLADLGFTAGDRVLLRVIARDALSRDGDHLGFDEREITLLTEEEKHRELSGRLQEVIDQIKRAEQTQRALRQRFGQTEETTPPGTEPPSVPEVAASQKRLERRLTDREDGLLADVEQLIAEAELNQLERPIFRQRLQNLQRELSGLDERLFPSLNQFLSRLDAERQLHPGRAAQQPPAAEPPQLPDPVDPAQLEGVLDELPEDERDPVLFGLVRDRQQAVEDVLGDITGALRDWERDQPLKSQLRELLETQRSVSRQTARLNQRTLGKTPEQLEPAERQALQEIADAQQQARRSLQQFEETLQEQLAADDAPESLEDLDALVQEAGAAPRMSQLSRELQENHLGQAAALSDELLADLQKWDDLLNERPVTDAELKLQFLDELREDLDRVADEQQALREAVQDQARDGRLDDETGRSLAEQETQLQEQTGRLQRSAGRLDLPRPEEALQAARDAMRAAERKLADNAEPQAELPAVEEALEEARRRLEQERGQLERQHARELLSRFLPQLKELRTRQQTVFAGTAGLVQRQAEAERWTRPLLRDLNDLKKHQEEIRTGLEALIEPLQEIEAVTLAAGGLLELMRRSVQDLADREAVRSVEETQPQILQRLEVLIAVLERQTGPEPGAAPAGGGPQAGEGQDAEGDAQRDLVLELTLLRAVQEQIHLRMQQLSARRNETPTPDSDEAEWTALENEQSRVLALLKELIGAPTDLIPQPPDQN